MFVNANLVREYQGICRNLKLGDSAEYKINSMLLDAMKIPALKSIEVVLGEMDENYKEFITDELAEAGYVIKIKEEKIIISW